MTKTRPRPKLATLVRVSSTALHRGKGASKGTSARKGLAAKSKLAALPRVLSKVVEAREFEAILNLIRRGRARVFAAANLELVDLYWTIGEHISRKVAHEGWGRSTVLRLADWLAAREAGLRGFSASNLWRMRQIFDAYAGDTKLAPLVRELPWSSNLLILAHCKTPEEREFYIRLASQQRWPKRELDRQLNSALFERMASGKVKLSAALTKQHPDAASVFKDRYMLEFLQLPENHAERDLQRALVSNLKQFLLELGRDFSFVGEQFCVQVGRDDFFIDLLFFHRGLQALVAIELKVGRFKPADLGQLQFYLAALDRDHKKSHEAPSIGVLLCKSRDKDVVEYALSRSLSPALVAEYQTKLPDKALLRAKMDEIYELITSNTHEDEDKDS